MRRSALPAVCLLLLLPARGYCQTVTHGTPPQPDRTRGWSWKLPPDLVRPDCGRRNPIFFVGEPVRFKLGGAAATYEVRDYWGAVVDRGPAGESATLRVKQPGWYKLYVFGRQYRPEWGLVVGGTTFVVFRRRPGFPDLPPPGTPGGTYPSMDEPVRGVTGMGPQRHAVDAAKPDEAIRKLEQDIAVDRAYYLPFDPYRKRVLMAAFPAGTRGRLDGVRKIVERFRGDITYWEPRNEPNFGATGRDFVENELKPFYETVKGVDPKLKVLGPGTVTIGPNPSGLQWIEDFLKAGGARYIDAFSFHAYNNANGDLWLARTALASLDALLRKYGAEKLEKWQTEQGYFAAVYGAYQPRLQGRWTMLQMMSYEQAGIPKEHNHLWYDKSHGFWDVPTWWENDDGGLNPAAALMRVWSEELYGTRFERTLRFGEPGDRLYLGSLFRGPGKSVAAFMSAGSTDGRVALRVRGGGKLHVVSAFGVAGDLLVRGGRAELPVPELPVYVELAPGQTVEVAPTDWGPDLARMPGVAASASTHPDTPEGQAAERDLSKLTNGQLENWYWTQQKESGPWRMGHGEFPCWVELRLPRPVRVARVVVYASPPWQSQSTLLDYELQVDRAGKWVTVDHVVEPARTFGVYSPATRTTVDSFFSDRWVFQHSFAPVTTARIRLLIHAATWGGGATRLVQEAGGQTWSQEVVLREIELYGR